jgi:hypothetical protein
MIPLAVNPNVTILVDEQGKVVASATNVAADLKVTVVKTLSEFTEASEGKTFINFNEAWVAERVNS